MNIKFELKGGESAEIFSPDPKSPSVVIYRFFVDRAEGAELKIIREAADPKIVGKANKTKCVDVATTSTLFIEAIGKGMVSGWYDLIA